MSCQKEITNKITENKAAYVIGLKKNQFALYHDPFPSQRVNAVAVVVTSVPIDRSVGNMV